LYFNQKTYTTTIILLLCLFSQSYASVLMPAGWIEKATLYPEGVMLHAKLDTGAKTTSINATNPEFFERDDKQWAHFNITNRDKRSRA
jgi:hypothetical protein